MAEGLLPPPSTGVSDIMETAKGVFRATLAKCLPLALVAILFSQLASLWWMSTGRPLDLMTELRNPAFQALSLIGLIAYALLSGMLMLRQRALLDGRLPSLQAELLQLLPRWLSLVLLSLLSSILVSIATLALVLPGVYLLVGFLVAQPVVIFEQPQPLQALWRSVRLLKPFWWRAFATGLIALLVVVVCWVAAAAVLGLVEGALGFLGASPAAINAVRAAVMLAVQAVAVVYFSAVWLALYAAAVAHSAASSSA
jgi:hypothetical protein